MCLTWPRLGKRWVQSCGCGPSFQLSAGRGIHRRVGTTKVSFGGPCVGCVCAASDMMNQKPDSGRMNRRKHPPASDLEPSLKKQSGQKPTRRSNEDTFQKNALGFGCAKAIQTRMAKTGATGAITRYPIPTVLVFLMLTAFFVAQSGFLDVR